MRNKFYSFIVLCLLFLLGVITTGNAQFAPTITISKPTCGQSNGKFQISYQKPYNPDDNPQNNYVGIIHNGPGFSNSEHRVYTAQEGVLNVFFENMAPGHYSFCVDYATQNQFDHDECIDFILECYTDPCAGVVANWIDTGAERCNGNAKEKQQRNTTYPCNTSATEYQWVVVDPNGCNPCNGAVANWGDTGNERCNGNAKVKEQKNSTFNCNTSATEYQWVVVDPNGCNPCNGAVVNWGDTGNERCNGNAKEKEQKNSTFNCNTSATEYQWVVVDPNGCNPCNGAVVNWGDTGNERCNGNAKEKEQKNSTFNCNTSVTEYQWVVVDPNGCNPCNGVVANWQDNGQTRCNGIAREKQQVDANATCTGNTTPRWVVVDPNGCVCEGAVAQWQDNGQTRCNGIASEKQQVDQNALCTGNAPRWVVVDPNGCICEGVVANWVDNGQTRCNGIASEKQQIDQNASCTGNTPRWVVVDPNGCICVGVVANWVDNGQTRCNGIASEKQQIDQNASCTGNTPRWVLVDPNGCNPCNGAVVNWQDTGNQRCNGNAKEKEQKNSTFSCNTSVSEYQWVVIDPNGCNPCNGVVANWINNGQTRCNGIARENQQFDANSSCTGNTTPRWVVVDATGCICEGVVANWQDNGQIRCNGIASEKQQVDANASCTGNTTPRWVVVEPSGCAGGNFSAHIVNNKPVCGQSNGSFTINYTHDESNPSIPKKVTMYCVGPGLNETKIIPTVNGLAIVDFTNMPAGFYKFCVDYSTQNQSLADACYEFTLECYTDPCAGVVANWIDTGSERCNGNAKEKQQRNTTFPCNTSLTEYQWVVVDPNGCKCVGVVADWKDNGQTRCNGIASEKQQIDQNASCTGNTPRWVVVDPNGCVCVNVVANWQDNGQTRCNGIASEKQQVDANALCTGNTPRWVVVDPNGCVCVGVVANWVDNGQTRCNGIASEKQQIDQNASCTNNTPRWVVVDPNGCKCVGVVADWQDNGQTRCNGIASEKQQVDANALCTGNAPRWIVVDANGCICEGVVANWVATGQERCVGFAKEKEERDSNASCTGNTATRWVVVDPNGCPCNGIVANWVSTGQERCVGFAKEKEERDANASCTGNTATRWVVVDPNGCPCNGIVANWVATGQERCVGFAKEKEERDSNASCTGNTATRWVVVDSNGCPCNGIVANWVATGQERCVGFAKEKEERDSNASCTGNTATRWVVVDPNGCPCNGIVANWVATGQERCVGFAKEKEERDVNASCTGNASTRWVVVDPNGCPCNGVVALWQPTGALRCLDNAKQAEERDIHSECTGNNNRWVTIDPNGCNPCNDIIPTEGTPEYEVYKNFDCDSDGIPNYMECFGAIRKCQDFDGDGVANYLDTDSDNDGIGDSTEKNRDSDGDTKADYLDLDSDNDGIADKCETAADFDRDGIPNYLDLDADNDNILDAWEAIEFNLWHGDNNLDGRIEGSDSNGNGWIDSAEFRQGWNNCTGYANTDRDGSFDYLDTDSDDDCIPDSVELTKDTDGDGWMNFRDIDSDNDCIKDHTEAGANCSRPADANNSGVADYIEADPYGCKLRTPVIKANKLVDGVDVIDNTNSELKVCVDDSIHVTTTVVEKGAIVTYQVIDGSDTTNVSQNELVQQMLESKTISYRSRISKMNSDFQFMMYSDWTNPVNVMINRNPIKPSITSDAKICLGTSTSIVVVGDGNITSNIGSDLLDSVRTDKGVTFSVKPNSIGLHDYRFTSVLEGCQVNSNTELSVKRMPVALSIAKVEPICQGTTASFVVVGDGNITSNIGAELLDSVRMDKGMTYTVKPGSIGVHNYQFTSSIDGCSVNSSIDLTVKRMPVALTISKIEPICQGSTANIAVVGDGAITSNIGSDLLDSVMTSKGVTYTVKPRSIGLNTYQFTSAIDGCSVNSSIDLTVKRMPVALTISKIEPICEGTTTNIVVVGDGVITSNIGSDLLDSAMTSKGVTYTVKPGSIGLNTYQFTSAIDGCQVNSSIDLTVKRMPVALTISKIEPICQGTTTSIVVVGDGNITSNIGADLLDSVRTEKGMTYSVKPNSIGLHDYRFISVLDGCQVSSNTELSVKRMPVELSIAKIEPICQGTTVSIIVVGDGNIISNIGADLVDSVRSDKGMTYSVKPNSIGLNTYQFISSIDGCSVNANAELTVKRMPEKANVLVSNTCFTKSTNMVIKGEGITTNIPDSEIVLISTNVTSKVFNLLPTKVGANTYSIFTNVEGCQADTTVSFMVYANPIKPAISALKPILKYGESGILSADKFDGEVHWSNNVIGKTNNVYPLTSTKYFAYTIDANGCQSPNSDTLNIGVLPSVPVIIAEKTTNDGSKEENTNLNVCKGDNIFLKALQACENGTIEWYRGNDLITNINQSVTQTSDFVAKCKNAVGYSDVSNKVNVSTRQQEINEDNVIVFPNPTIDKVYIRSASCVKGLRLRLLSVNGEEINNNIIPKYKGDDIELDFSHLPISQYILQMTNELGQLVGVRVIRAGGVE